MKHKETPPISLDFSKCFYKKYPGISREIMKCFLRFIITPDISRTLFSPRLESIILKQVKLTTTTRPTFSS